MAERSSPTTQSAGATRPNKTDRTRELVILNAIAEALNSSPDVQQALRRTLTLVAELLGLQTGWVWLVDADTGQFYSATAQHLPPYLQAPVRMTGQHCWCIEAFLAGELTPKNVNVMECSRLRSAIVEGESAQAAHLRYHASIPLSFGDKPLGIMNVAGPSWRELTRQELGLLSTIAYQVGIAIERARLADERASLARAEERARLAREIHDTLAQGLTAIGLQIEGGLRHLEDDPRRARERLEGALATTRIHLEEARRSVLNLRTEPLAGRPLREALGALARAFTSETGVRVRAQATGEAQLPLRIEAELYRIAQEALENVRRHACATEVTLTIRIDERRVRLAIRDDGQGFDPRAQRTGHYGLIGMRERARSLGGTLRITSRPGQGATVSADVPLATEAAE